MTAKGSATLVLVALAMRIRALCLFALLFGVTGFADSMLPSDLVKLAIRAARDDKLECFLSVVDVVSIQPNNLVHQKRPFVCSPGSTRRS